LVKKNKKSEPLPLVALLSAAVTASVYMMHFGFDVFGNVSPLDLVSDLFPNLMI